MEETTQKPKHMPTPRKMELSKEQELEIFLALKTGSLLEVGKKFGLDKYYGSDDKVRSTVSYIAGKVKRKPELYGISDGSVRDVVSSTAARTGQNIEVVIDGATSFRDKLDNIRDTAAEILTKKLDTLNTKKGIEGVKLTDIKEILAMAIDKSRLLRGESTENITKMSKIDVDSLKPEDALKMILRAREALMEAKT